MRMAPQQLVLPHIDQPTVGLAEESNREMFEVNDKVVHPIHGPGVIVDITQNALIDGYDQYYVIELVADERRLMIPVKNADEVGLRSVIDEEQLKRVRETLNAEPDKLPNNFKKRQAVLHDTLDEQTLLAVAAVVRDLVWRNREKRLPATDRKTLRRVKEMLAGEFALVDGIDVQEAMERIDATLAMGDDAEGM